MEPFLGQIQMFGFNFPPRGWAHCEGQLLPISQNSALFSLLGTIYGGDGRTTFALPDLRGRVPMHYGNGPGLTSRRIGQRGGQEEVLLNAAEMPSHSHSFSLDCKNDGGDTDNPETAYPGVSNEDVYHETPNAKMGVSNTNNTGGNLPHNNMQPYLCVNFCIALQGIFPSRS